MQKNLRKRRQEETGEAIEREFLEAVKKLWPVAGGSLSLTKSPCIREHCSACASGEGHRSYGLYGKQQERRFSIYVPAELAPAVQQALDNGRALQQLVLETGERYTRVLKRERSVGRNRAPSNKRRR